VLTGPQIRFFATFFLCCALIGAVGQKLNAEDRGPRQSGFELLAQSQPHEQQTRKATQPDSIRRQALLKRRVEQLRKAGKHDVAISTAQRSLALAERMHGREHPAVATALTTLGGLYVRMHRYPEAEKAYKRALEIRERSLGADHRDIVPAIDNLAGVYVAQGRYADAETLYKRTLAIQEKNLARDPNSLSDFSAALNNLANVYQAQGRTAEAEPLKRQVGEIQARVQQHERGNELEQHGPHTTLRSERRAPPESFGKQPDANIAPDVAQRDRATRNRASPDTSPQAPPSDQVAQSDWDVVPVFYGTDRDHEPNPKRLAYNSDRAHRLELGRALVTVPKVHQIPQIERPWAIRIPYFDVTIYEQAEDPKKHFTLQEIKSLTKADFLRLVRARLAGSNAFKNHALVFVHGYNTSFDNALYRTAQISYDLHFDGVPFVYSWPSGGGVASYTYDRESAEGSEPYLRQFLDVVAKETGAKTISVIAHSMGNKALLDVLKDMNSAAPKGVAISQLILAAPDVDADNFTNLAQQIKGFAKGVTLYAAANDRALLASRNFWGHYRAGDVPVAGPLVVAGVDTIDVTAASTDVFALNHSDYAQNNDLLTDIGKLISTGLRPPDVRFDKLKPVNAGKDEYWRYVPAETSVQTGTP
jgi:esterase/lipase superfamily enzyme